MQLNRAFAVLLLAAAPQMLVQARHDFQLRARSVDVSAMLEPEAPGRLLRRFEEDGKGGFQLDVELRLEPGETRVPKCPIP